MSKKQALISVSNKDGIVAFAKELRNRGIEIISTGGTKKLLSENGIDVKGVSDLTGFPEILDGRVKTLHPAVHGGLLAVRDNDSHQAQLKSHNIDPIDFVVVNLYPFKDTISKPDVQFDEAIENIDIGGPTMIRAAAKNHQDVSVIVDPNDYARIIEELDVNETVSSELKRTLAAKAFRHTAHYDALIGEYLTKQTEENFPEVMTVTYEKKQDLRYGENPHQQAAFYKKPLPLKSSIATAAQHHGKELSFNNINDADAALEIVKDFRDPAVVAVKHTNPCGVGVSDNIFEAYVRAYEADPVSIFGGIVALNREVNEQLAEKMKEIFLEIIIAPSFTDEALELLKQKKNLRLLTIDMNKEDVLENKLASVHGGLLVQNEDQYTFEDASISVPTEVEPTDEQWKDLKLAWQVVKHVKSNAILLAKDQKTVGVGAGQMNRVGAAKIAIEQAGDHVKGSVMASDAFFPMDDTVELAAKAGVKAIIQPGGSIRDQDSIKKCNEYGIAMVFTGVRHFKH
ncbi:bifunctional phosphoribosylaminoimidazolecarboxamide formyltransferase/IMP cyclohydrolase [Salirhabdus salicampi]|uniref:bifunctional phosphoribosylaminoimidazolecarboxamide formyltransferase/IMP cyclohydrolase n=1 Tax=Salirhabdus salicampi TaxID=476102 RepID=UPI0020C45F01|nr:bifunctional phosphoribosylaminoimidazolecarboxamide formyltransferase/IMP cyclohydrolase [Salirhabdus salicampi]MCP8618002.1 bifunctional phosphoribosylaminoimidazolecarboxamide formyltransferase/IMP cyclohydrolase [Salirhabdus salicampi]